MYICRPNPQICFEKTRLKTAPADKAPENPEKKSTPFPESSLKIFWKKRRRAVKTVLGGSHNVGKDFLHNIIDKSTPQKRGKNDGLNLIRTINLYKNTTQKIRHQVTHVCTRTHIHPYTHEQMHKYT